MKTIRICFEPLVKSCKRTRLFKPGFKTKRLIVENLILWYLYESAFCCTNEFLKMTLKRISLSLNIDSASKAQNAERLSSLKILSVLPGKQTRPQHSLRYSATTGTACPPLPDLDCCGYASPAHFVPDGSIIQDGRAYRQFMH